MAEIQRIAVIGAGTMGSGIAQVAAASGFRVTLNDVADTFLERGVARIEKSTDRLVRRGKLGLGDRAALMARIHTTTDLRRAAEADLVIEAIIEQVEAKQKVFGTLDEYARADTILASNTSSISITRIGAMTQRPDRVIGLHFMNPAPVMALVEVIGGLRTSDATAKTAVALAETLGKTPVQVKDSPGFALNRLMIPMLNEAMFMLMEGVASAEDIDTVMKLGANHPMGPLALADLIGLDTCLAIMNVLHSQFGDDKYRPCPLLRTMVHSGQLGRKTGQGFHNYTS